MAHQATVLIVGSGMAGLMAAHSLRHDHHLNVLVVDKGHRAGGRMATRHVQGGDADYGAQFFTVRHERFRGWVERWQREGLVYEWSRGWSDGSMMTGVTDGYPRYAVRGGMMAIPRWLAQPLEGRQNVQITALFCHHDHWEARDADGQAYTADAVLLTPPVPQSLALLDAGQVQLTQEDRTALERMAYAPCLAGIFRVDGEVHLPEPGAIQRPEADITWIADNQRKGISPQTRLITVHAGPDASRRHDNAPDDHVLAFLQAELEAFLPTDATVVEAHLKRWRYALPTTLHHARTLVAAALPPLAFAGDAFAEPRVEGAALSGLAAADALSQRLRP